MVPSGSQLYNGPEKWTEPRYHKHIDEEHLNIKTFFNLYNFDGSVKCSITKLVTLYILVLDIDKQSKCLRIE